MKERKRVEEEKEEKREEMKGGKKPRQTQLQGKGSVVGEREAEASSRRYAK